MRTSLASSLFGIVSTLTLALLAYGQRLNLPRSPAPEVPVIVSARGNLTPANDRMPVERFGFFRRAGVDGAADALGRAYKKKVDKSQIEGPIELSVDRLMASSERYLEFVGPANIAPGVAKLPVSPNQQAYVRLQFRPFRANVPHLLTWHMQNFHPQNSQSYHFTGSGINVKHEAKAGASAPISIVFVPEDLTPITIKVSASPGYWWRFYGVEISMLKP